MSFFNYRWDKCRVLAIGGTYVYLIEGGTKVGGTNVGGTNVGGTNVGGRKVTASFKCDHFQRLLLRNIIILIGQGSDGC
jgi:hypothetical protein